MMPITAKEDIKYTKNGLSIIYEGASDSIYIQYGSEREIGKYIILLREDIPFILSALQKLKQGEEDSQTNESKQGHNIIIYYMHIARLASGFLIFNTSTVLPAHSFSFIEAIVIQNELVQWVINTLLQLMEQIA